jgi:PAS domain S-box-containing protein
MKKQGLSIQDILDALPFYVLLIDGDHYILAANSAVQSQFGVKREEILGKYCPLVIHGQSGPFQGCPLEEAAMTGKAIVKELFDETSKRWVSSAVYPTRAITTEGKTIFLHIVIDITERKKAEEALKISRDQLQKLSIHLETVREDEQRKIARDLHDETSQLISSLEVLLEAANRTLAQDTVKTREFLKKAQGLSTSLDDEIHRLIYELRPPIIDDLGLRAAVESALESSLRFSGLKTKLKVTGEERRLSAENEISLFRVIQETFNNILKHSRTKHVQITISFNKEAVRVSIKDDGIGFDVKEVLNSKETDRGVGLIGMRERVELMGGTLDIESTPGLGTRVTVEVPYGKQ